MASIKTKLVKTIKYNLKIFIQGNLPCTKFVKSKYSNQPEPEEEQGEALHNSSKDQK